METTIATTIILVIAVTFFTIAWRQDSNKKQHIQH